MKKTMILLLVMIVTTCKAFATDIYNNTYHYTYNHTYQTYYGSTTDSRFTTIQNNTNDKLSWISSAVSNIDTIKKIPDIYNRTFDFYYTRRVEIENKNDEQDSRWQAMPSTLASINNTYYSQTASDMATMSSSTRNTWQKLINKVSVLSDEIMEPTDDIPVDYDIASREENVDAVRTIRDDFVGAETGNIRVARIQFARRVFAPIMKCRREGGIWGYWRAGNFVPVTSVEVCKESNIKCTCEFM